MVLEIELKRLGLQYSKGPYPWCSHVVVDRNLVTGQNPFSSEKMATHFLDLLANQVAGTTADRSSASASVC
jgi:putative intracellular protease/amidase